MSKLTPRQVSSIRARAASGESITSIAAKFDVSVPMVHQIVTYRAHAAGTQPVELGTSDSLILAGLAAREGVLPAVLGGRLLAEALRRLAG